VQLFLEQAARDPQVLAIKQTLYRTSGDSPIVDALIDAAQEGKQVLALVEIKARFDEQNNIEWARKLEESGVHVVYGLVGLKTHSKLSMVVRDDGDQLRRYCHIGTGNYHPKTARLYEDLGLITCDPAVGEDVSNLFNVLSGYSMNTDYERFLVAPHSVRTGLVDRIEREIEHLEAGRPAGIRFKCNSIVDEGIIDALYRASRAGVPVDIWVRGICAVRPGVPGLSENIRVISILGRFLEHSRAYCFENGGNREAWIGSADLMHRNLDRRVETLIRLVDPEEIADIDALFTFAYDPLTAAWDLLPDGTWVRRLLDADGNRLRDYQESLIDIKRKHGFAP
jgi:polyphosphate kinase